MEIQKLPAVCIAEMGRCEEKKVNVIYENPCQVLKETFNLFDLLFVCFVVVVVVKCFVMKNLTDESLVWLVNKHLLASIALL